MARNVIRGVCALAVISLILMINWPIAEANILVLDQDNRTIHKIEHLYEARFGKAIPEEGVWGHIAYTLLVPNDGCNKIEAPPTTSTDWIAVIKRGNCDFDIKVLHAQDAGYLAAIVFNNESDNLVPMGGGSKADLVNIPSVFIGRTDAEFLIDNFDRNVDFAVELAEDKADYSYLMLIGLVPMCILIIGLSVAIGIMAVRCVRDLQKRRRSRLSKSHLKKIPTKKFKKGDDYDICAICIDEYEEGDKLRILPCSHAYHQKCIDPWLTKNKKTCPICKRKVIPGRDGDSGSESSVGSDDEHRPLLPAQDLRRSDGPVVPSGASIGGTFDNSGLPANLRSHVMHIPDTDSDNSDSDEGIMTEHASSAHQSSVEVHHTAPLASVHTTRTSPAYTTPAASSLHRDSSPPPMVSYIDETNDGGLSEAASSVGIFGTGQETDDDDVTALIRSGGAGISEQEEEGLARTEVSQPLNMEEDHYNPAEEEEQVTEDGAFGGVEEEQEEEQKEEVLVVPGKKSKKKRKRKGGAGGRRDDEHV